MADEHPKIQLQKSGGGFPWPPVVVVLALLITPKFVAVIMFPGSPKFG